MSKTKTRNPFLWGLVIVLGLFIVTIIGFVLSTTRLSYSMVEEDYYDREIQYQDHIDKVTLTRALPVGISMKTLTGNRVRLRLPADFDPGTISGMVTFYHPQHSTRDRQIPLHFNPDRRQTISTAALESGRWQLKIDWTSDSLSYYQEFPYFR